MSHQLSRQGGICFSLSGESPLRCAKCGRIELMRLHLWVVATLLLQPLFARQPVRARRAMVVTVEPHATDIGVEILKSGGNAIDAAVAVGFALAVTHPSAGNIGG